MTTFPVRRLAAAAHVCNLEQRARGYLHTIAGMHRDITHIANTAGWVLGLGTVAWAGTFASNGWSLLLTWGLLPPLLLIRLRQQHWQPAI